jgi:CARDB
VNRGLILGILAVALVPVAVSAQQRCLGGNPAITHVAVQSTHSMGNMTTYVIVGSVMNQGTQAQPSSTLQFVDIYDGAQRVDSKSIPPLSNGATTHFTYNWNRASDAGAGSSTFVFKIRMVHGTNCNPSNGGSFTLKF